MINSQIIELDNDIVSEGNPTKKLKEYGIREAQKMAKERKDYIPVPSLEAGQFLSHGFSKYQDKKK